MTTLSAYWQILRQHDFYTSFSDDHRVWRAGLVATSQIATIAEESPQHRAMYEQAHKAHFSGEPWGTPKVPFPPKPLNTEAPTAGRPASSPRSQKEV